MDPLALFQSTCDALEVTRGNAVAALVSSIPTVWVAARTSWLATRWTGRKVANLFGWLLEELPPSPVAAAILTALDSHSAKWVDLNLSHGPVSIPTCRVLYIPDHHTVIRFTGLDGNGSLLSVLTGHHRGPGENCVGITGKDAYPLLTPSDVRLVEEKARLTIARIKAENRQCDEMAILDALRGCSSSASGSGAGGLPGCGPLAPPASNGEPVKKRVLTG